MPAKCRTGGGNSSWHTTTPSGRTFTLWSCRRPGFVGSVRAKASKAPEVVNTLIPSIALSGSLDGIGRTIEVAAMFGVGFRPIQGLPGYLVGNDGSVWSCLTASGRYDPGWHPVSLYRRPVRKRSPGYVVVCSVALFSARTALVGSEVGKAVPLPGV